MQKIDSESVARVKTFLLFAVFKNPDASVSQHSITIHQEQLDSCGTFLNFRGHRTSKSSIPESFQPEGVRASIRTAVPEPTVPSFFALICTSAAIRFGLSCSVRTTFVSHASVPILAFINFTSSPETMRDSNSAFLLADDCLRELRDKRPRVLVNRRRIVRCGFRTNSRQTRSQ